MQLVQPGGDAGKVAGGGEVARENFVDGAAAQPVRRRPGGDARNINVSAGAGRKKGERGGDGKQTYGETMEIHD